MNLSDYFEELFGLAGGFFSFFIGGFDGLVKLLVIFAVLDQITGIINAALKREWSSEAGFHGIAKKICMFILVGMANVIDHEMLGHSEILRDAVTIFYLANEGLSIIENAIDLGMPVPDVLKERFMTWRNKELSSKNEPGDSED